MIWELAVQALGTFNLACSATVIDAERLGRVPRWSASTFTLRVDLDRMRWCEGDCATTRPIARLTDRVMRLAERPEGWDGSPARARRGQFFEIREVNRESGDYIGGSGFVGGRLLQVVGHCRLEQFTGMPQRLF